eukprot:1156209-Pelagomonas_calceolata.AAC.3
MYRPHCADTFTTGTSIQGWCSITCAGCVDDLRQATLFCSSKVVQKKHQRSWMLFSVILAQYLIAGKGGRLRSGANARASYRAGPAEEEMDSRPAEEEMDSRHHMQGRLKTRASLRGGEVEPPKSADTSAQHGTHFTRAARKPQTCFPLRQHWNSYTACGAAEAFGSVAWRVMSCWVERSTQRVDRLCTNTRRSERERSTEDTCAHGSVCVYVCV